MPRPNSAATSAASRIWRAVVTAGLLLLLPAAAWPQQIPPKAEPDLSAVPEAEALRPAVAIEAHPTGCILEIPPLFRGKGNIELSVFIQRQLHWSTVARDFPDGRILAAFVVDTAGQVHAARIVQGLHPQLDAEVLRVISALTGFTPARQGRKPVAVEMYVPVQVKIR